MREGGHRSRILSAFSKTAGALQSRSPVGPEQEVIDKMVRWLFAALLVLQAHFAASYLVPLDREAQATFGGLLRWSWPWSIGDGGLLGRIPASGEYPISGV